MKKRLPLKLLLRRNQNIRNSVSCRCKTTARPVFLRSIAWRAFAHAIASVRKVRGSTSTPATVRTVAPSPDISATRRDLQSTVQNATAHQCRNARNARNARSTKNAKSPVVVLLCQTRKTLLRQCLPSSKRKATSPRSCGELEAPSFDMGIPSSRGHHLI